MKAKLTLLSLAFASLFATSCSEDFWETELEIDSPTEIELYSGETYQIRVDASNSLAFESENDFYASVSRSGRITAERVGETEIEISDGYSKAEINVTILPNYDLYDTPPCNSGLSRYQIKKIYGQPTSEDDKGLTYADYSDAIPYVLFLFDEQTDRYQNSVVLIDPYYEDDIKPFLDERYFYYDKDDDSLIYIDSYDKRDADISVTVSPYENEYWMVTYTPLNNSYYAPTTKSTVKELIK